MAGRKESQRTPQEYARSKKDTHSPLPQLQYTPIASQADFPSLLLSAIGEEGACSEMFSYEADGGDFPQPSPALRQGTKRPRVDEPTPPLQPQSRQHKRRARLRSEEIIKTGYRLPARLAEKHIAKAESIVTTLDSRDLPAARGAYTALNKPAAANLPYSPDVRELLASDPGFQYISASTGPRPIVDSNGLIIGVIAPGLEDGKYVQSTQELFRIIAEEPSPAAFSKGELNHKRGDFPAVNFGFTLPNGFQEPINLDHRRHHRKISQIRSSAGFAHVSNLQNSVFSFWHPGMYDYQKLRIEQVLANNPKLKRTSEKTVFPTTAVNFRNVCCCKHRDTQNCPFGWCAITALGEFDHTKGAHLILWELKLILEFPHGYVVLIPSATITHSNTPAAEGDTRVSITQYCAGSVLRYADNLCNTDKDLRERNKPLYSQNQRDKERRWSEALKLYSTMDSLRQRRRPCIPLFS